MRLKKIIVTLLLMASFVPMQAQVFIMEDDNDPERNVLGANGTYGNVIFHGSGDDQTNFTPIGDGLLLLASLGGAYLLKRKRRTNK